MSIYPMHAYIHVRGCVNATFAGILGATILLEKDTNSEKIPEHDTVMLTKSKLLLTNKFQNKAEKTLSKVELQGSAEIAVQVHFQHFLILKKYQCEKSFNSH